MSKNINSAIVIARQGVDLKFLAGSDSPLKVSSGAMGRIIAEKVLNGNGKAEVDLKDLKLAMDCQDGAEAFLDSFYLMEKRTHKPLLFALISNVE